MTKTLKATMVLEDGTKVKVDEARKDLKTATKIILKAIDEGRKATLKAATTMHAVKASGLYVASLSVADIRKASADGRKTAWAAFYTGLGLTKSQAARMLARVDTIEALKAHGVSKTKAEGYPIDTLEALWRASDKDGKAASEYIEALEDEGQTVTGTTVREAFGKGKNDPTDPKPVSIGKAVSMVLQATDSDRPIDYGETSLQAIDDAIDGLKAARVSLEAILAQAQAEADMVDDEDEDEDEADEG